MSLTNYFRLLVTLVIMNGVYTECGPWTALAFGLIVAAIEMHNTMLKTLIPPAKDECADEEDIVE